jgi:hypothetical protein
MSRIRYGRFVFTVLLFYVVYGVQTLAETLDGEWKPAAGATITSDADCRFRLKGIAVGGWSYATHEVSVNRLRPGDRYVAEVELLAKYVSNRGSYPLLIAKKIKNGAIERIDGGSIDAYRSKHSQIVRVEFEYSDEGNLILLLAKRIQDPMDFDICISSTRVRAVRLTEKDEMRAAPISPTSEGVFVQYPADDFRAEVSRSENFHLFVQGVSSRCGNLKKEFPAEESYFRYFSELLEDAAFTGIFKEGFSRQDCVHRVLSSLLNRPINLEAIGLGSAHLLKALALVDSGATNLWSDDERTAIHAKAEAIANAIASQLAGRKVWWAVDRANNYQHALASALGIACLRLPMRDGNDCSALAHSAVQEILASLPDDGSSLEGPGYWNYSVIWIVNYLSQLPMQTRRALVEESAFLSNAAAYRTSLTVPGFEMVVPIGDTDEREFNRAGTALRGLAMLTDSYSPMDFAERITKARLPDVQFRWEDIAWRPSSTSAKKVDPLFRTTQVLPDQGVVVWRASPGNRDEVLLVSKAGPLQGEKLNELGVSFGGHNHPDQGEVLIWNDGYWLLRDDGYAKQKLTKSHNTGVFNGIGQIGEGGPWFRPRMEAARSVPEISIARETSSGTDVCAEVGAAYPETARLLRWRRCVFARNVGAVGVLDDADLTAGSTAEWYWHFGRRPPRQVSKGSFCVGDKKVYQNFSIGADQGSRVAIEGDEMSPVTVRYSNVSKVRNLSVFFFRNVPCKTKLWIEESSMGYALHTDTEKYAEFHLKD